MTFFTNRISSTASRVKRGYSVIELMVTISIFALISTVILVNNQQFNGGIILTNLAYEVATTIRQAQVYGLGIRGFGSGANEFQSSYGVHFSNSSMREMLFYVNTNGDNGYQSDDTIVEKITIGRGNQIEKFCVHYTAPTSGDACTNSTEVATSISLLNIQFKRPNPNAEFFVDNPSLGGFSKAWIVVWSPQTQNKRFVTIESTGQISVSATAP